MRKLIWVPVFLFCSQLCGQVKTIQAVKSGQAPTMDGLLDDAAWTQVKYSTEFVQNFPAVGVPASRQTDVKIIYDNEAIYIGAMLYDDPTHIRKQITARDGEQQSDADYFSVFFDTYNDHQNGFQFLVTTTNVQSDARLGPNLTVNNGYGDNSWDAVWDSKVALLANGWSVEMKIPYLSLRFAKKDVQTWGLQLMRFIRRNSEKSFWNPVDPQVNGFVNQFGDLTGLEKILPPLRLSFSPYVTAGFRSTPEPGGTRLNEFLRNGGMDVKYGFNESFTLDATLIPDFGQVISDNFINNLTPFEVKFTDYRQFFSEGTEIFNKSNLFYSRRVGATPDGYNMVKALVANNPDWEIVRNPSVTQLYNATKFSGRTRNKLGIGFFNAVTAPMNAKIHNKVTGVDSLIRTSELANYNIFVLDQAFQNRSSLTLTNTNVIRNGRERDANVTALDFSVFDKRNVWNVQGTGRYSKIFGINGYDGYNTSLKAGKVSGLWQYSLQGVVVSHNYDPRDLGFLQSNNKINYTATIAHKQFKPRGSIVNHIYTLTSTYSQFYKPSAYSFHNTEASAFLTFKNFWDLETGVGYIANQHDYFVLGNPATYGKFVKRPSYGYFSMIGNSDNRKKFFFNYNILLANFFNSAPNKNYYRLYGWVKYRFSNKLSLDLSHSKERETDYIISAGRELNGDPIIAFVNFTDEESILSGIYNFTSRINFTMRVRHYLSRLTFNRLANVDAKGDPIPRAGTTSYDNVNFFNFDSFLTWDFRLGSRLILGYKNWLGDDQVINPPVKNTYFRNLGDVLSSRHGTEFTVKFIYFLDYNQLRKKR
ncbi:MAG: DUF5916 domain-containing protein [Bacteroidetes bacterium]|nr:DUF5916 domain-containing protein [Bacteroidota bacterium]